MTDFNAMTDEDWAKIRAILAAGGKLYVHPKTAQQMQDSARETGIRDLSSVIVSSSFVEEGTMVAAKADEWKVQPQPNEAYLALSVWQAVPCMFHMVHKKYYRRVGKTTFWWNHRTKAWSISREGEFQLAAHFGGAS